MYDESGGNEMLRKILTNTIALLSFFALISFAQDTTVNVNSFIAAELQSVPVIDGDLSDACWDGLPEIKVDKLGDAPQSTTPGDLDVFVKAAWDQETNALYFAVRIIDNVFINLYGYGSPLDTQGWKNERFEIMLDGMNTGKKTSTLDSPYHQEYCFDFPNLFDINDPAHGKYGMKDVPFSTEFVPSKIYEGITYKINPPVYPFNACDEYLQSAGSLRVTDSSAKQWLESPVEMQIEIKLVVFNKLCKLSAGIYDPNKPENIADDHKKYFLLPQNEMRILKPNDVIGISLQMCDSDKNTYPKEIQRNHQNTTTGYAGCWNSSERLSGLVLAPPQQSIVDFLLY